MRFALRTAALLLAGLAAACGGSSSPAAPTPAVHIPVLSGRVSVTYPDLNTTINVPRAKIEAVASGQVVASALADADGVYQLKAPAALQNASFELRASHDDFGSAAQIMMPPLTTDSVKDVQLTPAPLYTAVFFLVGEDGLFYLPPSTSVEIVSGPYKGRKAYRSGLANTFVDVRCCFYFTASAPGYLPVTAHLPDGAGAGAAARVVDGLLRMTLARTTPSGLVTFRGELCTTAQGGYETSVCRAGNYPYPLEATHTLKNAGPGTLDVAVAYQYVGDYYPNYLDVGLSCAGQSIWHTTVGPNSDPMPVTLPQRCDYELKLSNFIADRKGGDWTTYRVDIYPR